MVLLSAVLVAFITEMRCESELRSRVFIADQDPVATRLDVGGRESSFLFRLQPHICFFLGPLLPESLDVRNIPVLNSRELTMDLSGECCVRGISV